MQLNFAKKTLLFKTNSYFCLVIWIGRLCHYGKRAAGPNADLFTYPGILPRHHWFPCEMTSKQASANPILMTCHYPNVGTAFDWLKQISLAARQISSTTHIWVATRHHYRVCARCFDAI